jgi:hypothetical protein
VLTSIVVILINSFQIAFPATEGPHIYFNKLRYDPFDQASILIRSSGADSDPEKVDKLTVFVFTTSMSKANEPKHEVVFTETSVDSGYFIANIKLTADPKIQQGDIVVERDDDLVVQLRIVNQESIEARVDVDFYSSMLMLSEPTYRVTDMARIVVVDVDENRYPDTIDTLDVRVWSSTDRGGLLVTLRETGDRTGIFEELLTFTLDEESTGTRLRVSEGDTITAKYTDRTLPPPAALGADGVETVEVEELFSSATIGFLFAPLERAIASDPAIINSKGESVSKVSTNEQLLIQSEITNSQNRRQPFAYLVLIKDEMDTTVSLSWVTGELPKTESLKTAQSWIPSSLGKFTIEIFVWESIDKPEALSPVRRVIIEVS